MTLGEGAVLNSRYRLGPPLGRGGTADVYDGFDLRTDGPVAVKVLTVQALKDPNLGGRFEHEARAAGSLAHPNIVEVLDAGESEERPYLVMERLTGHSLADSLREHPLDQGRARLLASQLLGALAIAHAGGIVHRDIKPSNILWSPDGSAKLADFGIAKGMEHLSSCGPGDPTAATVVVGTPAYLAPERIGGLPATPRSDLWSVGVVLYEALAGVKPFSGSSALSVAYAVTHSEPVFLGEMLPDIDPGLTAAIHRSLESRIEHRFASAVEMGAALGVSLAEPSMITGGNLGRSEDPDRAVMFVGTGRTEHGDTTRRAEGETPPTSVGLPTGRDRPMVGAALVVALLVLFVVLVSGPLTSARRPAMTSRPASVPTATPPTTAPTNKLPATVPSTAVPPLTSATTPSRLVASVEPTSVPQSKPPAKAPHHHGKDGGHESDRGGG
jgi:serine/threonine-protein kinase